jgi:hypothetical protein
LAEQEIGVLDESTVGMLRQSLDAKLTDAVGIALPGGPVVIGAQPPPVAGPAAPRPTDALDELIERAPEYADRDPDEP